MLLVRRLKKKPSVVPKKKRVASLLLRKPLLTTPLQRLLQLPNQCVKARRLLQLHQHQRPTLVNATSSVVRTNHVPTMPIVVAVAMASAKTLRIVLRSRKKRLLHVLRHVLPVSYTHLTLPTSDLV